MAEKTLAKGLFVKPPHENAPSFVKMRLSFKVADFAAFIAEHENNNGYVDVDVLESEKGKLYATLNDFKPSKPKMEEPTIEVPKDEAGESWEVPF